MVIGDVMDAVAAAMGTITNSSPTRYENPPVEYVPPQLSPEGIAPRGSWLRRCPACEHFAANALSPDIPSAHLCHDGVIVVWR